MYKQVGLILLLLLLLPGTAIGQVTFSKDVAPIVLTRCVQCHHPGGSAPFSLLTYADVRSHATQIALLTRNRIMPPWKADPEGPAFIGLDPLSDDQIAILLGGRIAEEITMDSLTTGAGNDLERATELARKMVCEWGMSDAMGPLTFGKKEEQIFLGREIAQHRDYSEATAVKIDAQVGGLVKQGYDKAKQIIQERSDALVRIAEALLEREVLEGADIKQLIEGKPLAPAGSPPADEDAGTQKVLRPADSGKRVPGLSEGQQPA